MDKRKTNFHGVLTDEVQNIIMLNTAVPQNPRSHRIRGGLVPRPRGYHQPQVLQSLLCRFPVACPSSRLLRSRLDCLPYLIQCDAMQMGGTLDHLTGNLLKFIHIHTHISIFDPRFVESVGKAPVGMEG